MFTLVFYLTVNKLMTDKIKNGFYNNKTKNIS